jgi:hypothetical protein
MYKSGPNFVEINEIHKLAGDGMPPEEISAKLQIELTAIKLHLGVKDDPPPEPPQPETVQPPPVEKSKKG